MASAAAFDPLGVYLFVALETSREVAVLDAHARHQLMRIDVGRAPQGVLVSPDRRTLYVHNFMDRTIGVFDLTPLIQQGLATATPLATLNSVATEKLAASVLRGKQFFYDARDTRLARDRYMSCASCHNDGGHDGRVWDLTHAGEGLRNTVALRGRAGAQGFLHWSNNFDEVQDFEGQIRTLAGGTGLMTDAQFNTGTRSQPLGNAKAGVSADLDAMAAYVASLNAFDQSPARPNSGALSTLASEGRTVFTNLNCASCHGGTAFSNSGTNNPVNIGTLKPSSGQRLGGTAHRHRRADAARRVGHCAVPARWLRCDARRRGARAQQRERERHRPDPAGRLPARDRQRRGERAVAAGEQRRWIGRPLLQRHGAGRHLRCSRGRKPWTSIGAVARQVPACRPTSSRCAGPAR